MSKNYKKIFIKHYGPIPEGFEVHHIIPKFAGGTDDPSNLEALSKEDHKKAHLERYEKYGDFRDLCSYHMIGYNFSEAHKISSSFGGKKGGHTNKNNGTGIFRSEEERKMWASMGGKIGGKIQSEQGLGFHQYKTNPELHKQWSSKGGKTSGMFQNKDFQSEMGKRGGPKNKGFKWYTDDKGNSKKYTKTEQEQESFDVFIKRTGFRQGRK